MAMWHNGQLKETATIDASSAGLLFGWGVFTTLGIQNGRASWLEKHIARLRRDAGKCELEIPFSNEILCEGLNAVLRENGVQNGLARLTATRCDDGRWNTQSGSDLTIMAIEAAPARTRDLRVGFAKSPDFGELRGIKTTSYLPYFWSWKRAVVAGLDEVILFDSNERVVEAARSSVFWVRGAQLETAPLSSGALEGVGREIVLEWAQTNGVEARETEIYATDLKSCEEVFLVSAATGPRLVGALSETDRDYPLPHSSPIFESFHAWWSKRTQSVSDELL